MERWQIERVLLGRWNEAACDPPALDPDEWVTRAQTAREEARRPRLIVPPIHLATALNVPLTNHVPAGVREVTDGRKVWYRPGDPRSEGEDIAHGMGHVILVRASISHAEADAWGIAAELLFPTELALRVHDADHALRLQPWAPRWLLAAQIAGVLARLMAA